MMEKRTKKHVQLPITDKQKARFSDLYNKRDERFTLQWLLENTEECQRCADRGRDCEMPGGAATRCKPCSASGSCPKTAQARKARIIHHMSISSEVYDALLDWYVTSEEGQEALSQDTTKKSNSSPLTKSTSSPLKKSTSSQKTTKNDTHKTKTQSNPAAPTSTKRIRKMHCSAPESPSPEPTVQNPPPAKRARRASPAGNDVSREPTPSTRKARKQRIESESDASDTEISAAKPTRPERQTEDQLFKRPDTTQVFARFIKPTLGVSKTSKTVPMVPSSVSPSATSSPATNPPATSPPATSLLPASGHRTPDAACASLTIRSDSVTPSHSKLNPSCQSSRYHTPVESIAPFEGANNQSSLDPPPPNQRPSTSQTPASSCNPGRRPVDNDDKFISRLCDVKRSFEDVSSDLRFDRCSGGEALGRLNTAIDAFHSVLKPHV